jgi:hypothetical protein
MRVWLSTKKAHHLNFDVTFDRADRIAFVLATMP